MKAATILRAIVAMREVDSMDYVTFTVHRRARAMNELSAARNDLMTELMRDLPEIKIDATTSEHP